LRVCGLTQPVLVHAGQDLRPRRGRADSHLVELGRTLDLEADVIQARGVAAQELQLMVLLVGREQDLVAVARGLVQPEHLRHVGYRPFQVGHT
jgi:hypothetical protein